MTRPVRFFRIVTILLELYRENWQGGNMNPGQDLKNHAVTRWLIKSPLLGFEPPTYSMRTTGPTIVLLILLSTLFFLEYCQRFSWKLQKYLKSDCSNKLFCISSSRWHTYLFMFLLGQLFKLNSQSLWNQEVNTF